MKYSLTTLLLLILLFSCSYEDPFASLRDVDLISSVEPVTSWTVDSGTTFTTDATAPPSGYNQAYKLNFTNLVSRGTFDLTPDLGNWTGVIVSPSPAVFQLKTDGQMTGNNYIHMYLTRSAGEDYVYHDFNGTAGKNYTFKFDYLYVGSQDLQVSFGSATPTDDLKWNIETGSSAGSKAVVNFSISTTGSYQIRFGFSENDPLANSFEFYADNIALFESSNHSITYTTSYPHEGIYRLKVYAKMGTSNRLTMQLGDTSESYTLNSSWQEITLDAQLLSDNGSTTMIITPTTNSINNKFPGSVYITKPELYFLPDGS